MTLNAKSLGLAGGILWGVGLLILTLISVWTGYGAAFLNGVASIYPGYSIGYLGAVIGLVYGFVDAFIGLFVLAWLYNKLE
ncbi:bacteriophage holin [Candidatus Woesearchaeota archaeon]|nr:bacteriophage holin [Candidatus Woesearchaeota archaeon]